jgi:hypothetical protein
VNTFNPWHLVVYSGLEGANAANVDMTAAVDPIISQRNGHYIFSEQYGLCWICAGSQHLTNVRSNVPTWNAIGNSYAWPLNNPTTEGVQLSLPRVVDFRQTPLAIPMNEEIAWQQSNSASGATTSTAFLGFTCVYNNALNFNLPQGSPRVMLSGTFTATTAANAWSGANILTFNNTFKGGIYAVNGAWVYNGSTSHPAQFFRLFFPQAPPVANRILRPGSYVTGTLGNIETPFINNGMGIWGFFSAFEPVQAEVFTTLAQTAQTFDFYLDCTYLGLGPIGNVMSGFTAT